MVSLKVLIKTIIVKTSLVLLFIFAFICHKGSCQTSDRSIILKGIVVDSLSNIPIDSCIITLTDGSDKVIFYSNLKGEFEIALSDTLESYKVSFYKKNYEVYQTRGSYYQLNKRIEKVCLYRFIHIEEVKIDINSPLITIDAEKVTFNPAAVPGVESIRTFDLLKYLPGLFINDQSISYNGKSQIQILIDDKKRTLNVDQAIKLLQALPAHQVKKIELIPSGSVKYDASGSGDILNIITKKALLESFYFNTTNSLLFDKKVGNKHSMSTTIKKKRFNYFGLLNFENNYSERNTSTLSIYENYANNITTIDTTRFSSRNNTPYINIGVDMEINNKSTIALIGSYYFDLAKGTNQQNTFLYNSEFSHIKTNKDLNVKDNLNTFDLEYSLKFDTLGSKIRLLTGYIQGYNIENNTVHNYYYLHNPNITDYENTLLHFPLRGNQTVFQADVIKYLTPKQTVSFGAKHASGGVNDRVEYSSLIEDTIFKDNARSSNQRYLETTNAIYFTYLKQLTRKFSFLIGGRFESSTMKTKDPGDEQYNKRIFNNFFPSASLSYSGKVLTSRVSINKSIKRPYYGFMNNNVRYIDEFNIQRGNVDLKPSFTYNFYITNQLFQFININLGYQYSIDAVELLKTRDKTNPTLTVMIPLNAFDNNLFFYNFSPQYEFFKGSWSGQLALGGYFYSSIFKPEFTALTINNSRFGQFYFNWINNVFLSNEFSLSINFNFVGKNKTNQVTFDEKFMIDLGVRKSFFDRKLTASIYVNDFLKGSDHYYYRHYEGFNSTSYVSQNLKRFNISISYNIGKLKNSVKEGEATKTVTERFRSDG